MLTSTSMLQEECMEERHPYELDGWMRDTHQRRMVTLKDPSTLTSVSEWRSIELSRLEWEERRHKKIRADQNKFTPCRPRSFESCYQSSRFRLKKITYPSVGRKQEFARKKKKKKKKTGSVD